MDNLPFGCRFTLSRPFLRIRIDYTKPWIIVLAMGTDTKYIRFIAVFVCLSTRAVNLETMSDYTIEAFLIVFHVSQRSLRDNIRTSKWTPSWECCSRMQTRILTARQDLVDNGMQWHFNSPSVPHFGGILEAAVKSAKHHLWRVIGDTTLTYEDSFDAGQSMFKLKTALSPVEFRRCKRPDAKAFPRWRCIQCNTSRL